MGILKKEDLLYANENGKIIPQEVELWGAEDTVVKLMPLMPEEIQEILDLVRENNELIIKISEKNGLFEKATEKDKEIIEYDLKKLQKQLEIKKTELDDKNIALMMNHIDEPKLTKEEVKMMRPVMRDKIIKTMFIFSGIPEDSLEFGFTKDGKKLLRG